MRDLSYRVYDKKRKEYSDKAFSLDQYGILYVQDEDGYWEEASDRYIIELSTGLKDKNGKGIFEGDIVKLEMWDNRLEKMVYIHTTKVIWNTRYVRFDTTHRDVLSNELANDGFEVIGNIHENPELLKEEK